MGAGQTFLDSSILSAARRAALLARGGVWCGLWAGPVGSLLAQARPRGALVERQGICCLDNQQGTLLAALLRLFVGWTAGCLPVQCLHHPAGPQLPPPVPALPPPQVDKLEQLSPYRLYLVDWGYNTEAERQQAAANQRIEVVDIVRFSSLAGVPAPAAAT